jgi:hypothetical protein
MEEWRSSNQEVLLDLLDRTARMEERGRARDEWQAATTAEIKQVRAEVSGIRGDLTNLLNEIATAKTVARAGSRFTGWIIKMLWGSAAGAVGYLAALFGAPR